MDATSSERWLPIPEHPGYEVSDRGRVRSLDWITVDTIGRRQPHRGQMLKQCPIPRTGHVRVSLGSKVTRPTHQLVLEAFVGPRPEGMVCCHENGIPDDNRIENLRWDTPLSNSYDTLRHGANKFATKRECIRGHSLFPPNLSAANLKLGQRACLACMRARTQRYNLKVNGRPLPDLQKLSDAYYLAIMKAA